MAPIPNSKTVPHREPEPEADDDSGSGSEDEKGSEKTVSPSASPKPTTTALPTPAPPPAQRDRPIKVIVVADIICPWCYIALREIQQALKDLTLSLLPSSTSARFDIEFRPFFLNSNFGSDDVAVDRKAYLEARFGDEKFQAAKEMINQRGKEVGLELQWGGLMRQSTRVHRLLYLAYARGGMIMQQALLEFLYHAFLVENQDIGDPVVLAGYADKVGLMPRPSAEKWLRSKALEDDVKRLAQISSDCGITGVPFVVVEGQWALTGGQERGVYYDVFEKLVKGEMK